MNLKELLSVYNETTAYSTSLEEMMFWKILDVMEQEYNVDFNEYDFNDYYSWQIDNGEIWIYPIIQKEEFPLLEKMGFIKHKSSLNNNYYILFL